MSLSLLVVSLSPVVLPAQDLATADLAIHGAVLTVEPARQEVEPGRPTVVWTRLGSLTPAQVPAGLRVVGELSGPGLDSPLELSAVPGEPLRVPGLNREGTYTVSGLRLADGDLPLLEAIPDRVEIEVRRLVVATVTSQPLTPEEILQLGIVIDGSSFSVWRYTVGLALAGGTFQVPFDLLYGPGGPILLPPQDPYQLPLPDLGGGETSVPQVVPFLIEPGGGGGLTTGGSGQGAGATVPGFLVIPTDVAYLHQFFALLLAVQNAAELGSAIELHDLSAVLELPATGLREATTEPPTIPGEPVPVVDPGPDGELGTGDDQGVVVAGSAGEASWLVEGLEEGQHVVWVALDGELHGLASGVPEAIVGRIPGVVLVRDPRFAMTFFHPWVVRAGERYPLRVVVSNTSTTPVYQLSLGLPATSISGARLVDPDSAGQQVAELLPGDSATVVWELEALRTGRVTASAFNTSGPMDASFRFEAGVGELGVPLSPDTILLPPEVALLPPEATAPALELLGLAHSLATAPDVTGLGLPPVGESTVLIRGQELAAAGRRAAFGEPQDRVLASLGLHWMGARAFSAGFDELRRRSRRGHELEVHLGDAVGGLITDLGPEPGLAELEEVAITGRPLLLVYARGAGYGGVARLAVSGLSSGGTAVGQRADATLFERTLAGAAVLDVRPSGGAWEGEVAVVAPPLGDAGEWLEPAYRVALHGTAAGAVDLEVVVVQADGATRRFAPSRAVGTAAGSSARLDLEPDGASTNLVADEDGDGLDDWSEGVPVVQRDAPAPRLLAARLDARLLPPEGGPHDDLVLLTSQPVDTVALAGVDPTSWAVGSDLELDGGGAPLVWSRDRTGAYLTAQLDPRLLLLTCSAPLNPHATLGLSSGAGGLPVLGGRQLDLVAEPVVVSGDLEAGAVRGVVVGADGTPVAGAAVELYEWLRVEDLVEGGTWLLSRADRVEADAAGAFVLDAVRSRSGEVDYRHDSFLIRAVDPSTGHEARAVSRLAGDAAVRDLTLVMLGRGDVVGTVRRADGAALVAPEVWGRSVTNPEEGAAATPDSAGAFRLRDLPVGAVQLVARDGSAFTLGTASIPGPGLEASVELVLPAETSGPVARVLGTVVDGATAEPMAGVEVFLVPHGAGGASHLAVTGDDGAFEVDDALPGVTAFRVFDPARRRYVGERTVELLGDAVNHVQVVTSGEPAGVVRGTVWRLAGGTRTPAPGVLVTAAEQGAHDVTDAAGSYRLEDLPLGRVVARAYDPASGDSASRTVDLTADGQELVVDLDLVTATTGGVRVQVVDRAGVPQAGVQVAADRFGSGHEGRTAADGFIQLDGLAPGAWTLLAASGDRLGQGAVTVDALGGLVETSVVLGGTVDLDVVTLADTQGGGTVQVLCEVGYRRPGITSSGRIGVLPEEGSFSCAPGPPGGECWVDDTGTAHLVGLSEGVGALVVEASNPFYGRATLVEELDPSDHGQTLTLHLNAPGSVSGWVVREVDGELQPVTAALVEVWVSVEGSPAPQQRVESDAAGAFLLDLLPPGAFSLRVYHPASGGVAWLDGVIQSAQAVEGLELELRGTGGVQGEVAVCGATGGPPEPGDEVLLVLSCDGVPDPFLDGLVVTELEPRELEVDVGSGQAEFIFTGLAAGTWVLRATSATHGSAWLAVTVPGDGGIATPAEPLCLAPSGSVAGRVVRPETGEGAPWATVQLVATHHPQYPVTKVAAEVADGAGEFTFADLPVGFLYRVLAHDPASNRGGSSATVSLCWPEQPPACGLTGEADVELAPLGAVAGDVLDGGGEPVSDALVRLTAGVVVSAGGEVTGGQGQWLALSGLDGGYRVDGVPAGAAAVEAFDPQTPLYRRVTVEVDPLLASVTPADVALPATGEVTLRVVDPAGQEVPAASIDLVTVLRQQSRHFLEPWGASPVAWHVGPEVSGVVSDRFDSAACLGACGGLSPEELLQHAFDGALGGWAEGWMGDPPVGQEVTVTLQGRADLEVLVTQGGAPVGGAEVTVSGAGFYGPRQLVSQSGGDGTVSVAGLGVGSYSVAATLSDGLGNTLRGGETVELVQADHGQTVAVGVALEDAAAVDGRLFLPGGEPAPGARLSLTGSVAGGPTRSFLCLAAADGSFQLPAVPRGLAGELEAREEDGWGRHTLHGVVVDAPHLDPDGVLQLGDLELDPEDPSLAGSDPASGDSDVDVTTAITLDLSELMRHPTLTSDRLRLRPAGAGAVGASLEVSDEPDPDGPGPAVPFTRVTLTPDAPLPSDTLVVVDLLAGVEDLAGRSPDHDVHLTFRTRDTVPPRVAAVAPEDDPDDLRRVGPDVEPVVSFSEPVDDGSVTTATVRLLDDGGLPVAAALQLERGGFDLRLQPAAGLAPDGRYTVEVSGVEDRSGNVMVGTFQASFHVRDLEPPTVALLPPLGVTVDGDVWSAVEGSPLVLRSAVSSGDPLAAVVFFLDGVAAGPPAPLDAGSGEHRLSVQAPVDVPGVTLSVLAADVSGNPSAVVSHPLVLLEDEPPSGELSVIPEAEILPNHLLAITVTAADDHGLHAAHVAVSGAVDGQWSLGLEGTAATVETTVRVPAEAAAGAQVVVACEVEDTLGQRTALVPRVVSVLPDPDPPLVTLIEPPSGSEVTAGEEVTFRLGLEDGVEVVSATMVVGGEPVPVVIGPAQLPGDSWTAEASASWIPPEVVLPTAVAVVATAVDRAGHPGEATGTLTVLPLLDPDAPDVTFTCPLDGDPAVPGVELDLELTLLDDDLIQEYSLYVDGVAVQEHVPVDATRLDLTWPWTPPPDASPGTTFTLAATARDYAGNVGAGWVELVAVGGTVRVGDQTLDAAVNGLDLVLAAGTFTVLEPVQPFSLILVKGATVTSPALTALHLDVTGALSVSCGAAIDVTGRGYAPGATYPGGVPSVGGQAGSHVGCGGEAFGTTFGSVYHPAEAGGGSGTWSAGSGGGVVRVVAATATVDGAIRANGWGGLDYGGGAGGSIWLSVVGALSGSGWVEAKGGVGDRGGGGGAVALDYGEVVPELLGHVSAQGSGTGPLDGGAGTVLLRGPGAGYGDLIVDNHGANGERTVLPALGSGEAQTGSGGEWLVTERASIPPFFVGHWVEVTDGATGDVRGTWRVAAVEPGVTVTLRLEANPTSGAPQVLAGDGWQGGYLFDRLELEGNAKLESADPVRAGTIVVDGGPDWDGTAAWLPLEAAGTVEVSGVLRAGEIRAHDLVVHSGGTLSHPSGGEGLWIELDGSLVVEVGGAIDVTGRGYGPEATYPGEVPAGYADGGAHLGRSASTVATTYGSVYRPHEAGGGSGSWGGRPGGGVVRVVAPVAVLDGALRANGAAPTQYGGGGGGSVWLTVGDMSGAGVIEASGGAGDLGAGGGAIALEFGAVVPELLAGVRAAGAGTSPGGAGTTLLRGPGSVHGDLVVDNLGLSGESTELPGLGSGLAQTGSGGDRLVTSRDAVSAFFVGHWVEVTDGTTMAVRGVWRVATLETGPPVVLVLEPNPESGLPLVADGDPWRGVYRFDSVVVQGGAVLVWGDDQLP